MKKFIYIIYVTLFIGISSFSEHLHFVTFNYFPTMYKEGEVLKGGAIEVVKEAFRRMDVDITIEMLPLARGLLMLESGEVDGMFTLYKTEEREKYAYYPEMPVLSRIISFYVRDGSTITYDGNIESMLDYSIGVVNGYSYGKELDGYLKNESFPFVHVSPVLENTINAFVNKRFDILPHTKLDMIYLLKRMDLENEIKVLDPSIIELPVYLAFTREKEELIQIADNFSNTIKEMKKDGTYEKLLYKVY